MHHRKSSFGSYQLLGLMAIVMFLAFSCTTETEHMAEAISESDSLPMMQIGRAHV